MSDWCRLVSRGVGLSDSCGFSPFNLGLVLGYFHLVSFSVRYVSDWCRISVSVVSHECRLMSFGAVQCRNSVGLMSDWGRLVSDWCRFVSCGVGLVSDLCRLVPLSVGVVSDYCRTSVVYYRVLLGDSRCSVI